TSGGVMLAAADLATDHQLGIWEAVILSAAAEAGCPASSVRGPAGGLYLEGSDRHEPFRDA
ncbi:MAG TPA: hypothetical protein VGR84_00950, partial [Candidatus Acidoferrales bacterium]|nr:hypothetical protein [Candidatus Acidoferrales bacterium]